MVRAYLIVQFFCQRATGISQHKVENGNFFFFVTLLTCHLPSNKATLNSCGHTQPQSNLPKSNSILSCLYLIGGLEKAQFVLELSCKIWSGNKLHTYKSNEFQSPFLSAFQIGYVSDRRNGRPYISNDVNVHERTLFMSPSLLHH